MEALETILHKSNTLMIPQSSGAGDNLTSPQNIAQIMATYKHVMGSGGQAQSSKMAEQLLGGEHNN